MIKKSTSSGTSLCCLAFLATMIGFIVTSHGDYSDKTKDAWKLSFIISGLTSLGICLLSCLIFVCLQMNKSLIVTTPLPSLDKI